AATLWVALDLIFPEKKVIDKKFRNLVFVGYLVLIVQIVYGAFVAGLKAGLLHNHWPMMNEGKFLHETAYIFEPFYKNLIENPSGIQFIHRMVAYLVVACILMLWYKAERMDLTALQNKGINWLLILVGVQFLLGVLTLLLAVPLWLGVLHQVGAFFLLSAMTFTLHRFSK